MRTFLLCLLCCGTAVFGCAGSYVMESGDMRKTLFGDGIDIARLTIVNNTPFVIEVQTPASVANISVNDRIDFTFKKNFFRDMNGYHQEMIVMRVQGGAIDGMIVPSVSRTWSFSETQQNRAEMWVVEMWGNQLQLR